jgi:hypothetical protein
MNWFTKYIKKEELAHKKGYYCSFLFNFKILYPESWQTRNPLPYNNSFIVKELLNPKSSTDNIIIKVYDLTLNNKKFSNKLIDELSSIVRKHCLQRDIFSDITKIIKSPENITNVLFVSNSQYEYSDQKSEIFKLNNYISYKISYIIKPINSILPKIFTANYFIYRDRFLYVISVNHEHPSTKSEIQDFENKYTNTFQLIEDK